MISVFDVFRGTLPMGESFNEGLNEVSENREIGNSEGVEYSEYDIERIETVSDIMGEIFTDEVISNWENLSVEERASYLNEYYARAGQALGIDTKGVYVDDLFAMYGYGTMGVNNGNGYLGIDIRLVADPSQLGELLNTTTHEMRHQLQNDALNNPDAFPDIPKETLAQWEYEFTHYVDPSYDFEGYQSQAIETDARAFAEEVVNDYLSDAGKDTYSTAKYANEGYEGTVPDDEQLADAFDALSNAENLESESVEGSEKAADAKTETGADLGTAEGLEAESDLNKNTFSYTPAQCARVSTGTQNYCLFGGAGR